MALLFTDLLSRLGPAQLARRLNITQRTARSLRFAPLSRFPRVTANARVLTGEVKRNVLTRAGASILEANRHTSKSFTAVNNIRDRFSALVDNIAATRIEFRASQLNMSTEQWLSAFPEEFSELQSSIRAGTRQADRRIRDMERDSV